MKKIQVVSKKNCNRCEILKDWLNENDVPFSEWSVGNEKIQQKLLHDAKFTNQFCDIEGCKIFTPLLRIDDTGTYYSKHLFGIDGLRVDFIKEKIEFT
jgi:hypothetical protein